MTPKFSLVAAVAGAALLIAVPAFAAPAPDVVERTVAQREATMPQWQKAEQLRSVALNRQYGLGEFAPKTTYRDAHERVYRVGGVQFNSTNSPDAFGRAVAARGTSGVISGDDHVRIDPANLPTTVPSSSPSGREVEWPQVGIGFGIGMLLALGLVLALRMTRIRPIAH
jgi:hypothetical protein